MTQMVWAIVATGLMDRQNPTITSIRYNPNRITTAVQAPNIISPTITNNPIKATIAAVTQPAQNSRNGLSVRGRISTTADPLNIKNLTGTSIGFRSNIATAAANTFNCIDTAISLQPNRRYPTTSFPLNLTNKAGNRNNPALILPSTILTLVTVA
jgi:hypothetical protein|tara:strand:+ start:11772 stop:12236 length:465 start_codon:yes stop_codon:yes gene_type:complete